MPFAGYATLVIEDAQGKRVRNLTSETPFAAGKNTIFWDGLDDLGRDADAASHGVSRIPGQLVPPGRYTVRGLVRPEINLRYEMTPYTHGDPPWEAAARNAQWLGNHQPPWAVLFVPAGQAPQREGLPSSLGGQIMAGSWVTEGGSGLAWLDTNGKKLSGQVWIGGAWTGATHLARDNGPNAVAGTYAYTGSAWDDELRLYGFTSQKGNAPNDTRMGSGEERAVLEPKWKFPPGTPNLNDQGPVPGKGLGGLAVHNGVLVASLPILDSLLFVDARNRKVLGQAPLKDPRGLAFDNQGRLLALSSTRLLRYNLGDAPQKLSDAQTLISSGLEDPIGITLDARGNIYISDRGNSHQVKVFNAEGKFLRAIGRAGKPKAGPYDAGHMNNPNGVTIDDKGRLWVAETDYTPKRLSVWNAHGALVNAFYGPSQYGGAGELDPRDRSVFYYGGTGGDRGGMKWKLDWAKGSSRLTDIYYRGDGAGEFPSMPPQNAIYARGRRYMASSFNANATQGAWQTFLYRTQNGVAVPCAAMGRANSDPQNWPLVSAALSSSADASELTKNLRARVPKDVAPGSGVLFAWSDLNEDARVQVEEVQFQNAGPDKEAPGGIVVQADLAFTAARVQGKAMRYSPSRFTKSGVPVYDLRRGQVLTPNTNMPTTTGGDQVLHDAQSGWTVLTTAPQPFSPLGFGGVKNGVPMWSYPSLWPGLHASHDAPMPERGGQVLGSTRLIGGFFQAKGSDAGPMWAINGNLGNLYLMTADGLFVATLFKDMRTGGFNAPTSTRGQLMNNLSLQGENFFPTISSTPQGIYVQGAIGSLMRVEGLNNVRRLPNQTLNLSSSQVQAAQRYFVQSEADRQKREAVDGRSLLVELRESAPVLDGKLNDWKPDNFVPIDVRRSSTGGWPPGHSDFQTEAALSISGDRLYAAFRTDDANLLRNRPEALQNLFKSGGALDLMLGNVAGGQRLLVTKIGDKTVAVLYRPRDASAKGEAVKFTSMLGINKTTVIELVQDVSDQVALASDGGNFEYSIPLSVLLLKPQNGQTIQGDIGILRGNGFQTLQRVYWRNKATGLVSDLASEAELTPQLWGAMEFKAQ